MSPSIAPAARASPRTSSASCSRPRPACCCRSCDWPPAGPPGRAQVNTLRLELLEIGVQVIASVRRIVLRLPAAFPFRDGWRTLALHSGASPG